MLVQGQRYQCDSESVYISGYRVMNGFDQWKLRVEWTGGIVGVR